MAKMDLPHSVQVLFFTFALIVMIIYIDLKTKIYQKMWDEIAQFNYFSLITLMAYFICLIIAVLLAFLYIDSLYFHILQILPTNFQYIYMIVVLIFIFILYYLFSWIIIINSEKCFLESQKNPNRKSDMKKNHHVIIVSVSTTKRDRAGLFVGTDLLIQYFIRKAIPHQIYLCNPRRARELIQQENFKFLYLFGHGFQGGLTFHFNMGTQNLRYDSIDSIIDKLTIIQMHCNLGKEKSLCEMNVNQSKDKKCFILKGVVLGYNFSPDIWLNTKFRILNQYLPL